MASNYFPKNQALRWTNLFGAFTTCIACGGPDFSAPGSSENGASAEADASPEAQGIVICTECQDPVSTTDAGEGGTSDGAPVDAPQIEVGLADALGGQGLPTKAEAGESGQGSAESGQDATAAGQDSANSGQDSGVDSTIPGDSGACSASMLTDCGGTCVDTSSDSSNCGSCGNACSGGKSCVQSACACPAATLDCAGTCAACNAPPAGGASVCSGSTCTFACTGAGLTKCGSSCTDMSSDASNCGTCGHSCQGGACSGGQCQPVTIGTFSDTSTLAQFAIDNNYAYAAYTDGNILRCALSGCSSGAGLLAQNQNYLISIAANSSGVFWTGLQNGAAGGSVGGCAPASCSNGITTYATYSNEQPYGIATDGTNIYFSLLANGGSFTGVKWCSVAGCPPSGANTLESGGFPYFVAVSAGFAYWTDGSKPSSIQKCSTAGCTAPVNLSAPAQSDVYKFIVADSANVYWVDTTASVIYECPDMGCPPSGPIALATGSNPIAIDSDYVYWLTTNALVKCATGGCGGSPVPVLSGIMPTGTAYIAVDSANLYWFNAATFMRVAK